MLASRLISAAGAVLMATAIDAATICVNESGSGSCESSIQAAVTLAAAGDTVSVRNGEYFESVVIPPGKDGLKIKGAGRNTILDAEGTGLDSIEVGSANVTLTNFRIRNGGGNGVYTFAAGTRVLNLEITGTESDCVSGSADGVSVEASKLFACGDNGVDVTGNNASVTGSVLETGDNGGIFISGSAALVEGNTISGAEDGDCIEIDGSLAEVIGNTVAGCDGNGVAVDGDNPIVEGNRVEATDDTGMDISCSVCTTGGVRRNQVSNIADDDGGFGLDTTGMTVENNRTLNTADEGFEVSGSNNVLKNNRVDLTGGDAYEPCIEVSGDGNMLERNTLSRCADAGVEVFGSNNTLTRNRISDAREQGIEIGSGNANALTGNRVLSANAAAYEVSVGVTGTTLDNNRAGNDVRLDLCDAGTGSAVNANNHFSNTATTGCEL